MLGLLLAASLASGPAPCDNDRLLAHAALLVIVPHPDDEILGFGGLLWAYGQAHLPVHVVVVTDGDGACGACAFWNSVGSLAPSCGVDDLAAYAAARRAETTRAVTAIAAGAPELTVDFWHFPDGALAAAQERPREKLARAACAAGAPGVSTPLTGRVLQKRLDALLAGAAPDTLVGTIEARSVHPDHEALSRLVKDAVSRGSRGRTLLFGQIHPPEGAPAADCAFPPPSAADCGCDGRDPATFDRDPARIGQLRLARYKPAEPMPASARALRLCLPEPGEAAKDQAIDGFATQIGDVGRGGAEVPAARSGFLDCTGFLIAFVRTTEVYLPAP